MKKTFLAKRNAILSSTDVSWGAYALLSAILLLLLRLVAPDFFWQVFTPVFQSADALATESHTIFSSFGNSATLTLQNEKLRDENTALANENQALLQKAASVGALNDSPASGILAGVVARPPTSPYDTLVLAAGARVGITLGQEAFGAGGVPVGVVSAVLADFSRVTLFSSPGMSTNGWVGHASAPVTIMGNGGGAMGSSIARSAAISVGDTVFVPGPGALPIGKVVRIDSDPSSPSVILRIQPAQNSFSITWVTLRDTGAALFKALSQATSTRL